MKNKQELKETTNRNLFSKLYKISLNRKGKIKCDRCSFNKGCNTKKKFYGSTFKKNEIRHPSWKLVSKNRKQWMNKNITIEKKQSRLREYVKISW
jgi:hypothetical protein